MQAPTHILTGVLIQKMANKHLSGVPRVIFIISSGVVSHMVLDKFARMTYHPPKPLWKDVFWVIYHVSLLIMALLFIKCFWKKNKLGILSATAPDLDWILFRPLTFLFPDINKFKGPVTHQFFEQILSSILPIEVLNVVPDWKFHKWTVIIEFIFILFLVHAITFKRERTL